LTDQGFKAAISGAGAAEFTSLYGHDQYQKDYFTELGYPWEQQAVWNRLAPFYRVKDITTPVMFMVETSTGTCPFSVASRCTSSLKALGATRSWLFIPMSITEFTASSHIEDRLKRYLAWYGHYVKDDESCGLAAGNTSEPKAKAGDK
jgi:dipeptidyl aminopeptidase/acylaminoacyl peptidase